MSVIIFISPSVLLAGEWSSLIANSAALVVSQKDDEDKPIRVPIIIVKEIKQQEKLPVVQQTNTCSNGNCGTQQTEPTEQVDNSDENEQETQIQTHVSTRRFRLFRR